MVIYSIMTLFTSIVFISPDLRVYCWLCVDGGNRLGLRIHLHLCNKKIGCMITVKRICVNSIWIRILWVMRPKVAKGGTATRYGQALPIPVVA
jgi:hypothetical protein